MKPLIFVATLLLSSAAFATTECKLQNLVRTISVVYEGEGSVPCHVEYDKPTEGTTQIPWNAKNQDGYCEAKADELKQKLEGWGWTCTEMSEASSGMGESSSAMDESSSSMEESSPSMMEESSPSMMEESSPSMMEESSPSMMEEPSSEMDEPEMGEPSSEMENM